jgi:diaminohydroxyphosphoribosylaminopyrimidine deaminase/5-amino-6-(5-phosphoribosylamino)uracil reductase
VTDRRADSRFLARALRLARKARPSPNPRVGAVIVGRGRVVGEGFHERAGEPHAEVLAIEAAGPRARGATAYITLEPCVHKGRTPPCTRAIIRAGVKRVVIGSLDPNPLVNGRGVRALRRAGIRVDLDDSKAAEACQRLIGEWSVFIVTGEPFVRLKAALSLDGRMGCVGGDSKWITGEAARREAHRMRDRADAVLVGLGTVVRDDPMLTVRDVRPTGPAPIRVVLDPHLDVPDTAALIRTTDRIPTLVVHTRGSTRWLERAGGERLSFLKCRSRKGLIDLEDMLAKLAGMGITSLLVEGGGQVHTSFLERCLPHAVSLFVAPILIGGEKAVSLFGGRGARNMREVHRLDGLRVRRLGPDVLFEGRLR